MTESAATSSDAAAERAAEQARLRKERREAKIKAGGSARLNKINGMGGRIVGDTPAPPVPAPEAPAPTAASADPEEVDISQHYYAPRKSVQDVFSTPDAPSAPEPALSEAQLRQMMLGFDRPAPTADGAAGGLAEDPIMQMMSQMMAGAGMGGAGGQPGAMPSFPGMMPPQAQQQARAPDPYASIWKLLHALVALSLGFYIIVLTPFTGTKHEREREAIASDPLADEMAHHKRLFFWIFATAETLLLTTRLFLDKSRPPPSGILWTVLGFVPEPIKGYLTVGLRYWQIFSTVRSDILACIFVLGICSWWRG
ncbi:hypothetical protein B0I35DRAFT_408145 [Stachybotrys elegans]|uniref:GET complex subunit GET2 n=1 Tax=Stachybotrys elegans TaxID=80388 RepID=A0A8K0WSD2_9HYPO|nr:hypothetical protein B0I35DRAFT_408145 [Stachybotrys elegans]